MPDINDLTYFTVVRTVAPVPAGVLTADVTFEAQVTRGLAIQADLSSDVIEVLARPVHARIVDGVLMKDGTPGVDLLSAAEVAIDGGFSYTATFKNVRVDGVQVATRDAFKDLTFEALDTAGTFDLKDAAPIVASTAVPMARGPVGPVGVDGVQPSTDGLSAEFTRDGTIVGSIPVPTATYGNIIGDPGDDPLLIDAINSQVVSEVADASTVVDAAAAAVTADIAGRNLLETTDSRVLQRQSAANWNYTIQDPNNILAFGVDTAGDAWLKLRADALMPDGTKVGDVKSLIAEQAGALWQVVDSVNRLALGVDFAGDVVISGFSTPTKALVRSVAQSSASPIYAYGDSLTASGNWEAKLTQLLGVPVVVDGIGSQTSDRIAARQGGAPALVTLASDTIPASGAVSVTNITVPLLTRTPDADRSLVGTIAGIAGTLTHLSAGNTYSFTRAVNGSAVYVPPGTPFIPSGAAGARSCHQILWPGRNNYADTATVLSNTASMVKYLNTAWPRFLVLEIPPQSDEVNGSANRTTLNATNAALQAAYPHQFVPIATYLRSQQAATDAGITFTSQDLTDISNGITPTSFRADVLHPNITGENAIATYLARVITTQKGWPL